MAQLTSDRILERNGAVASPQSAVPFVVPLLAVVASAAMLYVSFAIFWGKFSRAEIFFAECAREMLVDNNWITPLYQSKPFFDKPILVYWLILAMYKLAGVSHCAARVPSILASLTTVAITGIAGRLMAGTEREKAGLVAAMCLASSFMFFSFSYLCMSDMLLVLFDTITMVLLYFGVLNENRRTALWLGAATSMGFAFVTKGPIGIVLPGIALLGFLAITKRLSYIKWYHIVLGALIAACIAAPWFYAAYRANGSWALAWFFIRENFQRYAGPTYDTHKPLWFMVTSLFSGFLPWSIFLPGALVDFFRQRKLPGLTLSLQHRLYLWIWLATVVAFFSVSRGKCDYYILPIYPAAAMLVSLHLTENRSVPTSTDLRKNPYGESGCAPRALARRYRSLTVRETMQVGRVLAMCLSGLFVVGGMLAPALLSTVSSEGSLPNWWLMPTALILFGALGLAAAASEHVTGCVTSLFLAICFAGAGFACQLLPSIGELQSLNSYADAMRATPPYTRVGVHRSLGHWVDEITFQVARNPIELNDVQSIVAFFDEGPGIALIPEQNFESALACSGDLRRQSLRVLDRRMVASHPLTPGYVLKRKGRLYDTTLVLVAN